MGKSKTTGATWSAVKTEIRRLEAAELVSLLGDLYQLSKENQAFLQARCGLATDPLADAKKIIASCVAPDILRNKPIQIAKAKKAISNYSKAVADPTGEAELMIFFVEQGNDFTLNYGDIDEGFYNALVLMFGRAIDKVCSLPKQQQKGFQQRLKDIIQAATPIGWGYPDDLRNLWRTSTLAADAETRGAQTAQQA